MGAKTLRHCAAEAAAAAVVCVFVGAVICILTREPGLASSSRHIAHLTISPAITRTCTSSICHKFVFATEKKPVRCQPPTPPIQVLYMYTGSPYSDRTESVPGGVKSYGNLEDTPLFALFDCSFQVFSDFAFRGYMSDRGPVDLRPYYL